MLFLMHGRILYVPLMLEMLFCFPSCNLSDWVGASVTLPWVGNFMSDAPVYQHLLHLLLSSHLHIPLSVRQRGHSFGWAALMLLDLSLKAHGEKKPSEV